MDALVHGNVTPQEALGMAASAEAGIPPGRPLEGGPGNVLMESVARLPLNTAVTLRQKVKNPEEENSVVEVRSLRSFGTMPGSMPVHPL